MFNKLNFKTLLIIFGSLLVLVILTQLFKIRGSERNFNSQLFTIDTAKISTIYIKPKGVSDEIKIIRNGSSWIIDLKGKNLRADINAINGMLSELAGIKADRIAGTDKSQWTEYEVTDSAIKVRVEQEGKIVADFLVGKFSYQQNPQKFTTFIRKNSEDETYAVQGFLSMTFGRGINDLRDKTLVNSTSQNITRVTFTYPADSSFVLSFENNAWKVGSEKADSAKTAGYISTLSRLSGNEFADEKTIQGKELFSVKIEGNNMQPTVLKAFESDAAVKYLITSSINQDAKFSDSRNELMKQIFASRKAFLISKK